MPSSEFIRQVKQSFQYLITEYSFSLVAEHFSPKSFGNALVKYSSETVEITIVLDRGQVLVDLRPFFDLSRRTYSLITVVRYLTRNQTEVVPLFFQEERILQSSVIEQIDTAAYTLKHYCSSILRNQFTEWEYMGMK
jgi:hypothetical protein